MLNIKSTHKKLYYIAAIISISAGILTAYIQLEPKKVDIYSQQFLSNTTKNKLNDFDSDYLIVDFWASWCQPCVKSLPYYQQLLKNYPPHKLTWVAINLDTNKQAAEQFLTELSLTNIPVFFDSQGQLQQAFTISGLPSLLILNKEKQEIVRIMGYGESQKKKLTTFLNNL